ncbi:response regulator [Spirosoma sp. BT702]|uniref:Response regulator n=1 Tax=Spirosoma profusum TaxID=2771354 RepID=A0A926XYP1_9BACT|nr:response regulator [Spirosoma profusum]MBD2703313.1 response regulator [Spirosoma profusum]
MAMKTADTHINTNFNNAKLLLVEPQTDQWKMMEGALRQYLPQVTTQRVANVEQAKLLLNSWRGQEWQLPKLILLNLYLPQNTDGWELLRTIKAMPGAFIRIPVLVYGPIGKQSDVTLSYEIGAATYLPQPNDLVSWQDFCNALRIYWWETVSLPPLHFDL